MKKFFLLMTFAVICVLSVSAQSTKIVTGAVIDKNGNPLPNALVEATGGAESVTTDADGTFRIEVPIWLKSLTARYAGFKNTKIKLNQRDQVIFEMKPVSNDKWFLNLTGSVGFGDYTYGSIGLMGGYLGKWGGYVKVMAPFQDEFVPAATAGVIKHIYKPFYLYLGLGYAPVYGEYESSYYTGQYWENYYHDDYESGAMFELGGIFKFKKFDFSVGCAYSDSFCCYSNVSIQLSVGYCF